MAASMICSRVSAGLRGSGLRATLGSATAKVAASRERGRAGPGRAGWGWGHSVRSDGGRSGRLSPLLPPSCPALWRRRGWQPVLGCAAGPLQLLACGGSSRRGSLFLPLQTPFPSLAWESQCFSLDRHLTHTRAQAVPVNSFQLASPQSLFLFPENAFS